MTEVSQPPNAVAASNEHVPTDAAITDAAAAPNDAAVHPKWHPSDPSDVNTHDIASADQVHRS